MKIKKLLNSMNGFSLVEMTVVLALMGAAAVGVMKMTETANKAGKNIETKDEISQLNNRINDILKNPTNCQASLGDRTLNSTVPIINQVINTEYLQKYTAEGASPANPNKVSIDSMIITDIDHNGSDGSQALATLRVGYRKPNVGAIGGQVLNKDILINANLCLKNFIQIPIAAPLSALTNQCPNPSRLVDGPHTWGAGASARRWAICQDCNGAITSNTIQSCQSQGSGGGVDISSLTELTCSTQGGVWDNLTSSCDTDDSTGLASCTALGGTYDADSNQCTFGGVALSQFIQNTVLNNLPACIVTSSACGGMYPNKTGSYVMRLDVTVETRSCSSHYRNFIGNTFNRTCTCIGNGCTCDTGQVGGYTRQSPFNVCTTTGSTVIQQNDPANRCCK
jgi:prepilin-type N-terminal cleavage/methylation domain-containing protein